MRYLLIFTFILTFSLKAQNKTSVLEQLKKDITYLSSDDLEGRLSGSSGEYKSALYIADEFKKLGLKPKGDDGSFLQKMSIIQLRLNINKEPMMIKDQKNRVFGLRPQTGDFFPLSYSCNNDSLEDFPCVYVDYGISAPELSHDDYKDNIKGKVVVIRLGSPEINLSNSRFKNYESLSYKVNNAIKNGARGVIFIRTDTFNAVPSGFLDRNIIATSIPVIYAAKYQDYFIDCKAINLRIKIAQLNNNAHNVIGMIDNKKAKTIVIAAHHDHLGYNEFGGSKMPNTGKVHNGANNNASGVAMMLQLMRQIKKSKKYKKVNYVFIAFSGEEQGSVGANYFINHPTIDLKSVKYMMNLNQIGRLDSSKKTLFINGTATSKQWSFINEIKTDTSVLKINANKEGYQVSDQAVFYQNNIPVLSFSTGSYKDYQTPLDKEEFINYNGMFWCHQYLLNLIKKTIKLPLEFKKPEEAGALKN